MPTLHEWLECDGLPVAKCNAYRSRRGLPMLEGGSPAVTTKIGVPTPQPSQRTESHRPLPMPSLLQRVHHFIVALQQHRAAGSPVCDDDQLRARLTICQACEQFDGQHCRICGCFCGANASFLNKLAWADQACPHPDGAKWGATTSH